MPKILIELEREEFERATNAKGKLTWKEVLTRNIPKSEEEVLKTNTESYFRILGDYAVLRNNSLLNAKLALIKAYIIAALDNRSISLALPGSADLRKVRHATKHAKSKPKKRRKA